jgi:hypothetical protein
MRGGQGGDTLLPCNDAAEPGGHGSYSLHRHAGDELAVPDGRRSMPP